MRIPREKTFQNCRLSNVVKCCQCMSYFQANYHCSILLILGIAGCSTAELPIAIGFSCAMCQEPPVRLQLREYQTASAGGFLPGTKSRSLFGESPATWHHDFSTNSSRILEEFLIFGRFQSFRCKSLSVHAKPDLSVWRVLKVPDRALPPLQGNLGRYPWLHESSLSSLSCNLLVILITQLTYLINSLSIAYHSFQVRTSQNSFHFHSFSFIFIHFQPCGTLVVLVYVFL